ncbi:MAG: hypothetical protein BWK80_29230 [Desulfobacteraceae bacterium IS3]|nr:MAG: hypothetical protein BWK80_29230 [Desulfobacteraceae bacterium IS3]
MLRFKAVARAMLVLLAAGVISVSAVWASPGDAVWKYQTNDVIISSPAVGADSTIYVGSWDGFLYALNPDGTLKWSYQTGGGIYSSPAVSAEGVIYVGSWDGFLYALDTEGNLLWRYPTGDRIYSSPAIGTDGTIYVGSYNNYLYAINSNGSFKWRFLTNGWAASSPTVAADGTVYAGSLDGYLYAINADGTLKWKYQTGWWASSGPAVGADGAVYVGSWDGYLYALNPDGTIRWRYMTDGWVASSPAIGADGTVYVGSWDDSLYAITPYGNLKWKYKTGNTVWSSPAIGADGTVYAGSWDGNLYAVKADGTLKWTYQTGDEIWSSPAIAPDGRIYVGGFDTFLHAVEGDSRWTDADYEAAMKVYADSPWPKFGQNNFNLHRKPEILPRVELPELIIASNVNGYPKKTVAVPLNLDNTGLNMTVERLEAEISYNETLLEFAGVSLNGGILEDGDYKLVFNKVDKVKAEDVTKIVLTITAGDTYLFKGTGVIAYLLFDVLGDAGKTTDLKFIRAKINDDEVIAEEDMVNGSVSIVAEPVPNPPSLALPSATIEAFEGGIVSAALTLDNPGPVPTPVEGIDITVTFDKTVLKAAEATLTKGVLEDENYGVTTEIAEGSVSVTLYANKNLFTGKGVVAYLNFNVVGDAGDKTNLTFTQAKSNEINVTATNGSVSIVKYAFNVSGNISYYYNLRAVSGVKVDMEGDTETFSDETDANGNYAFTDVPGGNYLSTPSKTEDLGGLSATDASRISRHVVDLFEDFDEYQLIAADVTRNGEITGTDASRVARYLAGLVPALNDEDIHWVFVPKTAEGDTASYSAGREYYPLESSKTNEDFIAVRLGDVTGDWVPGTAGRRYEEALSEFRIKASDTGSAVTVPLVLDQVSAIEGIDIIIGFDENVLAFTGATLKGGILENRKYGLSAGTTGDGELRLVIPGNSQPVSDSGKAVSVTFKVIGEISDESLIFLKKFDCNEKPAAGRFGN